MFLTISYAIYHLHLAKWKKHLKNLNIHKYPGPEQLLSGILGPSYMVSGTRDNPSPEVTLSSVYRSFSRDVITFQNLKLEIHQSL